MPVVQQILVQHPSMAEAARLRHAIRAEEIGEFLDAWLAMHPGDRLPGRQHFEPLDLIKLWPNMVFVDVHRDPYRFLVRVHGTKVVEAVGVDATGRYLEEAIPDFMGSQGRKARCRVADSGLPAHRFGPPTMRIKPDWAPLECLHLPLARDGGQVDQILSLFLYERGSSPRRWRA
jgi:hypothetical protein